MSSFNDWEHFANLSSKQQGVLIIDSFANFVCYIYGRIEIIGISVRSPHELISLYFKKFQSHETETFYVFIIARASYNFIRKDKTFWIIQLRSDWKKNNSEYDFEIWHNL